MLATSPLLEKRTGLYFDGTTEAKANQQAYDRRARKRLHILSCQLTGIPVEMSA